MKSMVNKVKRDFCVVELWLNFPDRKLDFQTSLTLFQCCWFVMINSDFRRNHGAKRRGPIRF